MNQPKNEAISTNSPPAADGHQSIRERILAGLEPIGRANDGREAYQLPNGARLVLSAQRQAKKVIMEHEGLSSRQFVKRRKQLNREAKRGQ